MSADNGIYIARFTKTDGTVEFRVTEAGAIDNIELSYMEKGDERTRLEDAYRTLYFKNAKSFSDENEAGLYALRLAKECYTEYGVCQINMDRPLTSLSNEEAEEIVYR